MWARSQSQRIHVRRRRCATFPGQAPGEVVLRSGEYRWGLAYDGEGTVGSPLVDDGQKGE